MKTRLVNYILHKLNEFDMINLNLNLLKLVLLFISCWRVIYKITRSSINDEPHINHIEIENNKTFGENFNVLVSNAYLTVPLVTSTLYHIVWTKYP